MIGHGKQFMGLTFRETEAVYSDHIMADRGYLFYGPAVVVVFARMTKSGDCARLADAVIRSEYRKRSVALRDEG